MATGNKTSIKEALDRFVGKKFSWLNSIIISVVIFVTETALFLISREVIETILLLISPLLSSAWFFIDTYRLRPLVFTLATALMTISTILAYRMRCRQRFRYGLLEIVIGNIAILWSARPILSASTTISLETGTQVAFQVVAGLYVIVRGLDNIEKSFDFDFKNPAKTLGERLWRKVFYSPERQLPVKTPPS